MDMTLDKYRVTEMEPGPFAFATIYFELINGTFLLPTDLLKDYCRMDELGNVLSASEEEVVL